MIDYTTHYKRDKGILRHTEFHKAVACFWGIIHGREVKRIIQGHSYKPKPGVSLETYLKWIKFLKEFKFFNKVVRQDLKSIRQNGAYVSKRFPRNVALAILTLMRYPEDYPDLVNSWHKLITNHNMPPLLAFIYTNYYEDYDKGGDNNHRFKTLSYLDNMCVYRLDEIMLQEIKEKSEFQYLSGTWDKYQLNRNNRNKFLYRRSKAKISLNPKTMLKQRGKYGA